MNIFLYFKTFLTSLTPVIFFLLQFIDEIYKRKNRSLTLQYQPLNRITLGQDESENNNRMIQLTDVFC
jgi:hypothetical protein